MNILNFDDLLQAARSQPEPQRLLMVFTAAEASSASGGEATGTLTPVLCVDKLPAEVADFASLMQESRQTGQAWDIVFIGSLPGRANQPPNSDEAEQPLLMMVEAIRHGRIYNFLGFDAQGDVLQITGAG